MSSYATTLQALAASHSGSTGQVRQLGVVMPVTPGLPDLPTARTEMAVLTRCFPDHGDNLQLSGPDATRASVLRAIADHSWVHLSCHASQRQDDRYLMGFALWDGTLTVAELAELPTTYRDLACLSACQTATGSVRHLDEALHLAAATQFLGYRHVVATMWPVADESVHRVTESLYSALTAEGSPASANAAGALDQAVRNLRRRFSDFPQIWAPYLHFGA